MKQLFIDGQLIDIDDNFQIIRNYQSPFFKDVNTLKNNTTYATLLPSTINNMSFFEHCYREDTFSDIPYVYHKASYIEDGYLVFKDADVKILQATEDGIKVQFVWGISREKYITLFDKKLNEIIADEINVLSDDWIIKWEKSNMFATGKKYKYIDYVSGERDTEIYTIDGIVQPPVIPDEPYKSNLKEMTMHPFISFGNILDLIAANSTATNITKEISFQFVQNEIEFTDVAGLEIWDLVYSVGTTGDIRYLNIRITGISGNVVTFNYNIDEVQSEVQIGNDMVFSKSTISSSEFQSLKDRLINKGIILGGNKGNKTIEYVKSYASDINFDSQIWDGEFYGCIPLSTFDSSFRVNGSTDFFGWREDVLGNQNDELEVYINLSTNGVALSLFSIILSGTNEVEKIQDINYSISGSDYVYDTIIKIKYELGKAFFIGELYEPLKEVKAGGEIRITHKVNHAMFSMLSSADVNPAYYDCLMNLPEITPADFINEMLKMTGLFIYHDDDGNIKFISLDNLKSNIESGNVYNWDISDVKKGNYQFNSNAQKNAIKFNNTVKYMAEDYLLVDDQTIEKEKDLYKINFDLAEQSDNVTAEFILYKQKSILSENGSVKSKSFENNYSEKPSVCVYDSNGIARFNHVLPNNLGLRDGIFTLNVTRLSNYSVQFTTPTSGNPVPEVGSKIYIRNILSGGLTFRGYVTEKDGNILTTTFLNVSGTTFTWHFDNSSIGFVPTYYDVYGKIIKRPTVRDVVVKLDVFESSNIDFEKPVYVRGWGKYCVLLELTVPEDGLCDAKLLLINQTL